MTSLLPSFNIIACVNEEGIIGCNNDLFIKCSEDMKRFKKITTGSGKNVVIMGRKTWESIPRGYRPLKDRINIVLSENSEFECIGAIVCSSFQNALKCCNEKIIDEIFVIGGETLYNECFRNFHKNIDRIYLTKIHKKASSYHDYKYFRFDDTHFTLLKNEECRENVKIFDPQKEDYVEYECPVSYEVYSPTERIDEFQYLRSLKEVFEEGSIVQGRNGKTFTKFGMRMEYDLERFPLLTTKKMGYKTILKELIWFLNGETDNELLREQNVRIWDGNSTREFLDSRGLDYPEGDLGPIYGFQWRHFGANYRGTKENYDGPDVGGMDQIKYILNEIKTNPTSRRIILSAWNPPDLEKMALPPCHVLSQYHVDVEKGTLSCQLYQRSGDMFLGVPYNIASYSFLTYIFAHLTGYKPGKLIHIIGDAHIYEEHIEAVHTQLTRTPKMKPRMIISDDLKDIDDVRVEHFTLEEYESHETIKAPMIA
tara:strand:- start:2021 stop:3466 length:1446 start_codon:yes stop_codon:yes gene_type:complete